MKISVLSLAAVAAVCAALTVAPKPAQALTSGALPAVVGAAVGSVDAVQNVRHRRWHRYRNRRWHRPYRYCPRVRVCTGWGYNRRCWWERRC